MLTVAQVQNGPAAGITLEIHGQVRFAEGGAPAENVLVRLESYDAGGSISEVFTDRMGKFRFSGLVRAQYTVRVRQTGYREAQQNVDLHIASSGYVLLQLAKDQTNRSTPSSPGSINANVPVAAQREFDKGVAALTQRGRKNTAEATVCFEKAIAIYPQFVEARLKLGTAYMDLEEWDKAEKALLATLDVDPTAVNALFALSEIYLQLNKIDDAEKILTRALQIEDRSYFGHLNLARVQWERARNIKELAAAKPALEASYREVNRALQLNTNLAGARLLKGNLLLLVGRANEALIEFDEYLRLEPKGEFANETREVVEKIKKAISRQGSGSSGKFAASHHD
jgi:tetratricopeptide (TPR) repeat protein